MIPFRSQKRRPRHAWLTLFSLLIFLVALSSASQSQPGLERGQPRWKRSDFDLSFSMTDAEDLAQERSKEAKEQQLPNPKLARRRSSPAGSLDFSPHNFETAPASEQWSPASTPPRSPPALSHFEAGEIESNAPSSPAESIGQFGPHSYPSLSTSGSESRHDKTFDLGSNADVSRDNSQNPQPQPNGAGHHPFKPLHPDKGASQSPAARFKAALAQPSKEVQAIAAEPFNGGPDLYLQSPANKHIKDAIAALPQSRDKSQYVLVSMADKTEPDGKRVYKFFNRPFEGIAKERVPYIPKMLYRVHEIEEESKAFVDDPQIAIKRYGWRWQARPNKDPVTGQIADVSKDEVITTDKDAPPATGWRAKLDEARVKMRTKLSDWRDAYAVGMDRSLENYYTTNGRPVFWGRNEMDVGLTVPLEARRAAQKYGKAQVFYDPLDPKTQVRLVYTGRKKTPVEVAPDTDFRGFKVDPKKALPFPVRWRNLGKDPIAETLSEMKRTDEGMYGGSVPERWPTKMEREWAPKIDATKKWFGQFKPKPRPKLEPEPERMSQHADAKGIWWADAARAEKARKRVAGEAAPRPMHFGPEVDKWSRQTSFPGSRPYIGPFDIVTPDERWQQAEQRTQVGQRLSNGVGAAWSRVKAIPGPRTWFKRPQAHTSTGGVEAGGEAAGAVRPTVGQRLSTGFSNVWLKAKAIPGPASWFKRPQQGGPSTATSPSTAAAAGETEAGAEAGTEAAHQAGSRPTVGQRLSTGLNNAWSKAKAIPGPTLWYKRPQQGAPSTATAASTTATEHSAGVAAGSAGEAVATHSSSWTKTLADNLGATLSKIEPRSLPAFDQRP